MIAAFLILAEIIFAPLVPTITEKIIARNISIIARMIKPSFFVFV